MVRMAEAFGRVLLGGIFIAAGIDKVRDFAGTKKYTESKKLPFPGFMVGSAAAMELGAGPLLVLGVAPRFTASALAGFLIPTALLFHDFWNQEKKSAQKAEAMQFFKDVSIIGGLILYAAKDFEKARMMSGADLLPGAAQERAAVRPDYLDNAQFDAA
jgi:putative oxidoreductase